MQQAWEQCLVSQKTAGTNFASYTTAKTVINQQDLYSFYPNFFQIGRKLRITVHMAISNRVTGPDTTTFQVMLGTIVVWTSGAINLTTTANTTLPAKLVIDLTCQLANTGVGGVIAKLMGQGVLTGIMFNIASGQANNANNQTTLTVPLTVPALGTAFDGTIAQILDFWVAQSFSGAGNGVTVAQYDVEDLTPSM